MSNHLSSLESLSALIAFAAAVDARNFSAASRKLGLSASAVAKAIERLELRVGKRLLNRTTRAVSLTAEGEVLYRHVLDIVRNLNEAEHELHLLEHAPCGTLKIHLPTVIGRRIVLPAMSEFHERYPDVMPSLHLDDCRLNLIGDGYDVALWLGELADSGLQARRLGPLRLTTFAAPEYLSRHGIPTTPAELAGHRCIHYRTTRNGRVEAWLFQGYPPFRSLAPATVLNDEEAIVAAAIAGLGLAQTPAYLVSDAIAAGHLQPVLASHAVEHGSVSLVWPRMLGKVPRVRVFIDFIAERITAQLYGAAGNAT